MYPGALHSVQRSRHSAFHIFPLDMYPGIPALPLQGPEGIHWALMGSLDQHCSSPSFTWSVQTKWTPGINFTGRHPGHGWPYGSACAWCILLTPLGLTPMWVLFWVVPRHSTAGLYLFPYSVSWCSTSEILKGKVLGYYRNLGSLRYGMSTAFLAVLWAARLSRFLRRNMRIWELLI